MLVLLLMFPVPLKVHKAILTKIFSIFPEDLRKLFRTFSQLFLKFCGIFLKMLIRVIYLIFSQFVLKFF